MADLGDRVVVRLDRKTLHTKTTVVTCIVLLILVLWVRRFALGPPVPDASFWIVVILVVCGSLVAVVAGDWRSRVVLLPDGIEVTRSLSPTRRLRREDIVARDFDSSRWRGPACHVLITQGGKRVSLPPYLEDSPALTKTLEEIPLVPGAVDVLKDSSDE